MTFSAYHRMYTQGEYSFDSDLSLSLLASDQQKLYLQRLLLSYLPNGYGTWSISNKGMPLCSSNIKSISPSNSKCFYISVEGNIVQSP